MKQTISDQPEASRDAKSLPQEVEPCAEREVEAELFALAAPSPSIWVGIFLSVLILISIVMLIWFFGDLRYLLRTFQGPMRLGDASSLNASRLENNAYVTVQGVPRVTRSIDVEIGRKWFALSDTSKKMFPLAGQPRLFVVWKQPARQKAWKDPGVDPVDPFLPGSFEGRLVRRDRLGEGYEKIWRFYKNEMQLEAPVDVFVLIDGDLPQGRIWVVLVYLIFGMMAIMNSVRLRRFITAWRRQP